MNAKNGHRERRFAEALLVWFAHPARDLPWRRTLDPYAIWISEVMLQQTQVKTVIPYWERWMQALPTIKALAECKTDRVLKLWEGLGYYRRARNLQNAARKIMREHGGRFPHDFEAVLQLPGIGRYTAGAICSIAFNQPTPVLDGNAIRVLTRYFGVRGDPNRGPTNGELWSLAQRLVGRAAQFNGRAGSGRNCSAFNQALMELGATMCSAVNARCGHCPVRRTCYARKRGCIAELPQLPPRQKSQRRHFVAAVVESNGKLLLRRRPSELINGGLWEFPNEELSPGADPAELARRIGGGHAQLLCTIQHTITRYRITLQAFSCRAEKRRRLAIGKWLSLEQAMSLALPSAHRQVLEHTISVIRSNPDGAPARVGRDGSFRHDRE